MQTSGTERPSSRQGKPGGQGSLKQTGKFINHASRCISLQGQNGNQDIYKGLKANKTRNKSSKNERKCFKSNQNRYWKANTGEARKQRLQSNVMFGCGGRGQRGYPDGLLENTKLIKGVNNNMNTHARRQQHVPDSKNSSPSTRERHHGGVSRENQSPHDTSLLDLLRMEGS